MLIHLRCDHPYVPTVKYPYDACFDIYACEELIIPPNQEIKIHTGVFVESICFGYHLEFREKSGVDNLWVRGGVIDTGYQNELLFALYNTRSEARIFQPGDPFAQVEVIKSHYPSDLVAINGTPIQVLKGKERGLAGGIWKIPTNLQPTLSPEK